MNRQTVAVRNRQARELVARAAAPPVTWVPEVTPILAEQLAAERTREQMRRWWLARYTLDEIRELAAPFVERGFPSL